MMMFNEIWRLLTEIHKDKENNINIKFEEISWGDRYYNEYGHCYKVELFGDEYEIGYIYITEDSDDWGQAESYKTHWCYKNGKNIERIELYNIITNYKEINRNKILEDILN